MPLCPQEAVAEIASLFFSTGPANKICLPLFFFVVLNDLTPTAGVIKMSVQEIDALLSPPIEVVLKPRPSLSQSGANSRAIR